MTYQNTFKRYELKYLLTKAQQERIVKAMLPYMALDAYGKTTIRNLYFDTNDYRLARYSIGKPKYKEKLRVRSYSRAQPDSDVFVELKKKYKGIVYKRRILLVEDEAMHWLSGVGSCPVQTQITEEIDYFLSYYETLQPVVFLSYDREAYFSRDGSDFRATFDERVLCRQENLSLKAEAYGTPLLPKDRVLLELKCSGGMPLWMARLLSAEQIYQASFSKYGSAYQTVIFPTLKEGYAYA